MPSLISGASAGPVSYSNFYLIKVFSGDFVGVDPLLMSSVEWNKLSQTLEKSNIKLVGVKNNLVDIVWNSNRPNRPKLPIIPLEMKFAGKSWDDKVTDLQNQMREKRANVLILTALDDVGK